MENGKDFLKEEIRELMKIRGNIRGDVIKGHQRFILLKEGEEGLKKIKKKMSDLGCSVNFKKIQTYGTYPASLAVATMLVAKDLFHWEEKDIKESAIFNIKNSFILRTYLRNFVSLEKLIKIMPKYWEKDYDFGKMEVKKEGENKIIWRLKDYNLYPLNCTAFLAITKQLLSYVLKEKEIYVEEVRCIHKGDIYHEFVGRWN